MVGCDVGTPRCGQLAGAKNPLVTSVRQLLDRFIGPCRVNSENIAGSTSEKEPIVSLLEKRSRLKSSERSAMYGIVPVN